MEHLKIAVDQYLSMHTSYALMITGEWGAGKTYFYKNELESIISATPTLNDLEKNYKPIHISLFGISSIDEIRYQILAKLLPLASSKAFRIAGGVLRLLAKPMLRMKGMSEIYELAEDIGKKAKDELSLQNIVLCFDDLERKDAALTIESLAGFINTIVENEDGKVLLIANELKIDDISYKTFKEKIVGFSVIYIPDFFSIYGKIIDEKFGGSKSYTDFLLQSTDLVYETFFKHTNNFRTLVFALSFYQRVFDNLCNRIPNSKILAKQLSSILNKTFNFCLVISIEFRKGVITADDKGGLDVSFVSSLYEDHNGALKSRLTNQNEPKGPLSRRADFMEQYFPMGGYFFYAHLYDYITGKAMFVYDEMEKNLFKEYNIIDGRKDSAYAALEKLYPNNCYELDDNEYKKILREVLKYAFQGRYSLPEYLSVFYNALKFSNPLSFSKERLKRRIYNGMRASVKSNKFVDFEHILVEFSSNNIAMAEINEYAKKLNDQAKRIDRKTKLEEYKRIYLSGPIKFAQDYIYNDEVSMSPFFIYISAHYVYRNIINSNPKERYQLFLFFQKRYSGSNLSYILEEYEFVQRLLSKIKKKAIALKGKNVSGAMFSRFNTMFEKVSSDMLQLK